MDRVLVAPGLELDDEMYEVTLAALGEYAPEQVPSFTRELFMEGHNWVRVPDVEHLDADVPFYKAELRLKDGEPYLQTLIVNLWLAPDLRRDGKPWPHSHPWEPMVGIPLLGGYVDDQFTLDNGVVNVQSYLHEVGQENRLPMTTFHEVTEILVPGRTLTLMNCGPSQKDAWGYLNPDTGLYIPNKKSIDPRFIPALLELNPHLR